MGEHIRQTLLAERHLKPFLGATGMNEVDEKTIEESYVQLAIIQEGSVEEKYINSNRSYQLNLLQKRKEFISLAQIFQSKDKFVFISGVPGIGKSTMVKKMALEWKNGRLWNGKGDDPKIHIILPILCRELNNLKLETVTSPEQVLRQIFPDLPDFKDLKSWKANVLVIIDGIDELRNIDSIDRGINIPLLNLLRSLLHPAVMVDWKCMAVGRPNAIHILKSYCATKFKYKPKRVEICGFDEENIRKYVRRQLGENDESDRVIEEIESAQVTKNLCSIPLYAWILTCIFKDDPVAPTPTTSTELLLYALIVFLRRENSKKEGKEKGPKLTDFIKENHEDIKMMILEISKFAFETLEQNQIIFSAEKNDALEKLKDIGMLIVLPGNETTDPCYQFGHLVLQELFAAFHILLCAKSLDLKVSEISYFH